MRRAAPDVRVIRAAVGLLERRDSTAATGVIVSVGLAGGLTDELLPGTVVIPERITSEEGTSYETDAVWSGALRAASQRLGFPTSAAALVTTVELITGDARRTLASSGYRAVDMESAALAASTARIAVVRVILDTPSHDISSSWRRPARAVLEPWLWRQGARLAVTAPRYAARAARVVGEAARSGGIPPQP